MLHPSINHLMPYALPLTLLIILSGCGSSSQTPTAQVTGEVTLEGQPLQEGRIVFETTNHRPASGRIENGKILDVTTYSAGDGAPLGAHQVAVFATKAVEVKEKTNPGDIERFDPKSMSGESIIPKRYNNPQTSELSAEVKKGDKNHFVFELKNL